MDRLHGSPAQRSSNNFNFICRIDDATGGNSPSGLSTAFSVHPCSEIAVDA